MSKILNEIFIITQNYKLQNETKIVKNFVVKSNCIIIDKRINRPSSVS